MLSNEPMETPLLEVKGLTTTLQLDTPTKVVRNLSFSLKKKQTLAIVGESGSGKSMTALSLLQLINPHLLHSYKGEVLFRGKNLLTCSKKEMQKLRGHKLAMIFQNPSTCLNPVYSIGDQLLEVLWYHTGKSGQEAQTHCIQALDEVGIPSPEERLYAYPHELSGGMLQRVMIAMALLLQPDILIADEPTTALDVTVQLQILQLIRRLQETHGMATLLITHDLGVVAEIADEVLVMYATEMVEKGDVHTLFNSPSHPYTQGLFRSLPRLRGEPLQPIQGTVPSIASLPRGCRFHPRCPKAMDTCKTGTVPTFSFHNNQTRCWLYDPAESDSS